MMGKPTEDRARTPQEPEETQPHFRGSVPAPPLPGQLWKDSFGRASIRALQILLIAGAVTLLGYLVVTLKIVTLPLLLALIIASAMHPIIRILRRAHFNRIWAAITALLGIVLVLAAVISSVVMTVIYEWSDLAVQTQEGFGKLVAILTEWGVPLDNTHIQEYLHKGSQYFESNSAGSSAVEGVSVVTQLVAGALLMIVMLFFFLLDGPRMWAFLVSFVPARLKTRINDAGHASVHVLGRYIRGTVIIAAFAAVVDLIAMLVMGVPLAFPLAALIFLSAFIPIVGALVTGTCAALVALVAAGPAAAIVLIIVVILVNQIEHHILQPKVMGSALSLHGIVIISALAIGAHQGGVAGALLAVPMSAVGWASYKAFRSTRFVSSRESDLAKGQDSLEDGSNEEGAAAP
ncbi:AI-2E family transporter [Kocuria sp. TGY1127_2]|uniref:AI-2E family transporter n=1 Tax=Kocuria sp. TGY1127_2 TaxID=2711328 RepID=UPI0015B7AF3C|nr:AI-2E family transporter [Kocuria sp. TGY1127_2]